MRTKISILSILAALIIAGCASSRIGNYDRHAMSRLYTPHGGEDLIFEASVSPDYPADSETAEATRMLWISQWLEQRKFCANGFEVEERIPIGSAADNPYRHDLRYIVRCVEMPAE